MADVEAQVLQVRSRISAAQRARHRAEMERENAQAAADKARAELIKFGVTTVDEAREMLARLKADLDARIAEDTAALNDLGL